MYVYMNAYKYQKLWVWLDSTQLFEYSFYGLWFKYYIYKVIGLYNPLDFSCNGQLCMYVMYVWMLIRIRNYEYDSILLNFLKTQFLWSLVSTLYFYSLGQWQYDVCAGIYGPNWKINDIIEKITENLVESAKRNRA